MSNLIGAADRIIQAQQARIQVLEKGLREIADKDGLCIYNHDTAFQDGSFTAFTECAGIAKRALLSETPE